MTVNTRLVSWMQLGLIALVAIMPFHAFLSVWGGHALGHQTIWQSWKEVLLLIEVVLAAILLWKDPGRRQRLRSPIVYAVAAFTIVSLVVTALVRPELGAAIFGLKTDVEFLIAAILAWLVSDPVFIRRLIRTVLISSGVVIAFGLLQAYLLPRDWLVQFGYGPDTIQPYALVDPVLDSVRIIGTLGGFNQLGSFLILPLSLVFWYCLRKPQWWHLVYLTAGLTVLWHTYSRGAYIGLAIAFSVLIITRLRRSWRLPALLVLTLSAAISLQLAISHANDTNKLQYYLFHQSVQDTGIRASTDQHIAAYRKGLEVAQDNPLGKGLGTAGPASFQSSQPFIPENYYLQIAIEAGAIGLLIFLAIQVLVAIRLWQQHTQIPAAAAVLATLAGISVLNLALHGWADSSTALVFWTTAGAIIGSRA